MNWNILDINNWPITLCGLFYSVLCIFSIVTGLLYALNKRRLNPIEISDKMLTKLNTPKKLSSFARKMGIVTFIVGLFQGLTAFCLFKGYSTFNYFFPVFFTIFSIFSASFKLKGRFNIFPLLKLIAYILILIVITIFLINSLH